MQNKFKVALIANDDHPLPSWLNDKFTSSNIDCTYNQCFDINDLYNCPPNSNLLWLMSGRKGLITEESLDIFPALIAVVRVGSGTDNIDLEACTKRGIIVGHAPDDMIDCTSDHFIAMLFAAVRQIPQHNSLIRKGIWDAKAAMSIAMLKGADLGIIGFGKIGQAIAKKLTGFEMSLRIFDPYVEDSIIRRFNGQKVELEELLTKSQFVLVACPLTKQTKDLIGEKEMGLMREDSILVNCARGGIVNERALIETLKQKRIKAAALDVVENPPLEFDSELLKLDNLIITPHSAGYVLPYPDAHFKTVTDVIVQISKGQIPKWIANKEVLTKSNLRIKKTGTIVDMIV